VVSIAQERHPRDVKQVLWHTLSTTTEGVPQHLDTACAEPLSQLLFSARQISLAALALERDA